MKNRHIKLISFVLSCIFMLTIFTGCSSKEVTDKDYAGYTYKYNEKTICTGLDAYGQLTSVCYDNKDGSFYCAMSKFDVERDSGVRTEYCTLMQIKDNKIVNSAEIGVGTSSAYFSGMLINDHDNLVGLYMTYDHENDNFIYTIKEYTKSFKLVKEHEISSDIHEQIGEYLYDVAFDGTYYYVSSMNSAIYKLDTNFNPIELLDLGVSEKSNLNYAYFVKSLNNNLAIVYSGYNPATFTEIATIVNGEVTDILKLKVSENLSTALVNFKNGDGEYITYAIDNVYQYGITSDGTVKRLLSWVDLGIDTNILAHNIRLDNGTIYTFNIKRGDNISDYALKIITLEQVDLSVMKNRKKIDLTVVGTLNFDIQNSIIAFNRSNEKYYVSVNELDENGDDKLLKKFDEMIINGTMGDIIIPPNENNESYVTKGLYEDLYNFIDNDTDLSREDFFQSALKAMETDGKLYELWTNISIHSAGSPSDVFGSQKGLSYKQLLDYIKENPDKILYFPPYWNGTRIVNDLLENNLEDFINFETGECNFVCDDMRYIFEIAAVDYSNISGDEHTSRFWDGKGIIEDTYIFDIGSYLDLRDMTFGGLYDVNMIGLISADGEEKHNLFGKKICMNAKSQNKDGAWEFIKFLFAKNYNNDYKTDGFSPIISVFDECVAKTVTENEKLKEIYGDDYSYSHGSIYNGPEFTIKLATMDDFMVIKELIQKGTQKDIYYDEVMTIILEEADEYFNGKSTLDDTLDKIQNRVSLIVAEKS